MDDTVCIARKWQTEGMAAGLNFFFVSLNKI